MKCMICDLPIRNIKSLSIHLRRSHQNYTPEMYYRQYLKTSELEGYCRKEGCNNQTGFISLSQGFFKHCSRKCNQTDKISFQIGRQTMINKYGADNPMKVKDLKDKCFKNIEERERKRIETNIKRYGTEAPTRLKFVQEKTKNTCLKKYGVEFHSQRPEFKDHLKSKSKDSISKRKQTCLKVYGLEVPQRHPDVQDKMRDAAKINQSKRENTNIEKYGFKSSFQNKEVQEKFKENMLKKYGYPTPSSVPEIQLKIIKKLSSPEVRSKISLRYLYEDKMFDSSWELAFYIFCKDKGLNIEVHPLECKFEYEYNGKLHRYYPDFKIDDKYYEIKGPQFLDNNGNLINPFDSGINLQWKEKQKCMLRNNVIIITDCNKFINYVEQTYGKKYLKKFKKKIKKS